MWVQFCQQQNKIKLSTFWLVINWQGCSNPSETLGGVTQSRHSCLRSVCSASCSFINLLCVFNLAGRVISSPYSAQTDRPPPHLQSVSPTIMPSVSRLLTVLVGLKNLGIACWLELKQQMCGVCDSQWAAVLQPWPAGVRSDRWVHTACLRPECRD